MPVKLKNTNGNAFKEIVVNYLCDILEDEIVENSEHVSLPIQPKVAAEWLWQRFDSEYNHPYNHKRYGTAQETVAQWLQGLAIPLDYTYHDIALRICHWHEIEVDDLSEKQYEQLTGNWWNFMAFKIVQLWRDQNVNVTFRSA